MGQRMMDHKLISQLLVGFALAFSLGACGMEEPVEPEPSEPVYSFFVAGHTYGHPVHFGAGLHSAFKNQIEYLNNYPGIEMGVLTGDVVPQPTAMYWDAAETELDRFNIPIHIASGNHDRGQEFIDRFEHFYYQFTQNEDLFIILSPTQWNIEGDQKVFLEQVLQGASAFHNIFVFLHELIWWSPDSIFQDVEINFRPHYPGSTNFWNDIYPLLTVLPNDVVIFAGDMGAHEGADAYMYHQSENVTLIGSGMGGGVEDNIVVVDVSEDGGVSYTLLDISSSPPVELAVLEDYKLP